MTRPRKYRRISLDSIDEPTESILSGVENLFDVAMVFAVALSAVSTSVKPACANRAELSSIAPRFSIGTDADSAL